jgi:hypothetical protein
LVAGSAARGHGATEGLDEVAAVFGKALSAASDDNLAYLQHLCASSGEGQVTKGQVTKGQVTKDEFALWLLYLLGRIDATDIQVVRETFGTKKEASRGCPRKGLPKRPPLLALASRRPCLFCSCADKFKASTSPAGAASVRFRDVAVVPAGGSASGL